MVRDCETSLDGYTALSGLWSGSFLTQGLRHWAALVPARWACSYRVPKISLTLELFVYIDHSW